jgi:hypothetical protein
MAPHDPSTGSVPERFEMASRPTTRSDQSEPECPTPAGAHARREQDLAEQIPGDCPTAGEVLDFWEPRDALSFLAGWG